MKTITHLPRKVREIENAWVPMSDGCRLAARIRLPEDAETAPVPAILEYIPYRKRDVTAERDAPTHAYFAGHGYAAVRVDLRGSGDSDGVLEDEYLGHEQDDAVEVVAWLAAQPWCTGAVGMMGISWGGFNALQVAARRPPALKAIITLCSTDDRYADDIHYMGGCLLNENLAWASTMFAFNARPPDPEVVGERWRKMWLERLEGSGLWIETWLRHQRRDSFWKHGSVCEDFGAIQCAVYAVGGWADGYSNAIPRLLAGLNVPRKGLIGPWAHKYPHFAKPEPAIGFLQEALRWWDHWLKGEETGVMDEPMLRVWMQESVPPHTSYEERPGRWVAEPAWPAPGIEAQRYALAPGTLEDKAQAEDTRLDFQSLETIGLFAGEWCPYGLGPEMPSDQRSDDGNSLTFDTAALPERLEILGAPVVTLELAADRPNAFVAARLCDVAPDGASTRVTYGLLNLTHRQSHEHPEPLEPGRRYQVRVQLNDIAHAFPAGHRIRLALSSAYWPLAWPSPEPVTLSLFTGASTLELPVRPPRPEDGKLKPLPPPEGAPPLACTPLRAGRRVRTLERDVATGATLLTVVRDEGRQRIDARDLEFDTSAVERYRILEDDPLSARAEVAWTIAFRRGGWRVRTETVTVMTATRDAFLLTATLDAFEGETRVLSKSWHPSIPRDGV